MGPIYMNEVQCRGTERTLWDCPHKAITAEDCQHVEDASVKCNVPYMGFEKTVRKTLRLAACKVDLFCQTNVVEKWNDLHNTSSCGHCFQEQSAFVV